MMTRAGANTRTHTQTQTSDTHTQPYTHTHTHTNNVKGARNAPSVSVKKNEKLDREGFFVCDMLRFVPDDDE